tara:strand:- start:1071 stop:4094 length:3024 start_codon:yes stop_codon:yes gene_type:complete
MAAYDLDQSTDNSVLFDDVVVRYPKGISEVGAEGLASAIAREQLNVRVTENEGDIESVAERATTLESAVNDPDTGLSTKASQDDLSEAVSTESEARATQYGEIQAQFDDVDTALASKASVSQLGQAQTDNAQARASLDQTLRADYDSKFGDQQQQIDAKAAIDRVDQVESDAESARGQLGTDLTVAFQAADSNLQEDINTRATVEALQTAQSDNESARAALRQAIEADYDGKLEAKAAITYVDESVATETAARGSQYDAIQTQFENVDGELASKASSDQLDEAFARASAASAARTDFLESELLGMRSIDLIAAPGASPSQATQSIVNAKATERVSTDVGVIEGELVAQTQSLSALSAVINDPDNGLSSKASSDEVATAVATETQARSTQYDDIQAQFGDVDDALGNRVTVGQLADAQSDNEAARGLLSSTLAADYNSKLDAQQQQINARATNDRVDTVESDAVSARAQLATALTAAFEAADADQQTQINNRATITQLQDAQTDNESARGQLQTTIEADYDNKLSSKAAITYVDEAVSDESAARATQYDAIQTQFSGVDAELNTKATTSALSEAVSNAASARATLQQAIEADYDGKLASKAAITYVDDVVSDEASARASQYSAIQTSLSDKVNASTVSGMISDNNDVILSPTGALATAVRQVTVSDGASTATIEEKFTAQRNELGQLSAQSTIKVEANGVIAGIGLSVGPAGAAGVTTSNLVFRADKIAFTNNAAGSNTIYPFVISGNVPYFNGVNLLNSSVGNDKIDSINANKIVADQLSAISANLGTVTSGLFKTKTSTTGYRGEFGGEDSFIFWYGTGSKTTNNALFCVDTSGNVTLNALDVIGELNVRRRTVSDLVTYYSDSTINPAQATWTTVATLNVNVASGFVGGFLEMSWRMYASASGGSNGTGKLQVRVLFDNVVPQNGLLYTRTVSATQESGSGDPKGPDYSYTPGFPGVSGLAFDNEKVVFFPLSGGVTQVKLQVYMEGSSHRWVEDRLVGIKVFKR